MIERAFVWRGRARPALCMCNDYEQHMVWAESADPTADRAIHLLIRYRQTQRGYSPASAPIPYRPAEKSGMMSPASNFSFDSRPASSSASKSGKSRSVSSPNSSRNSFVVT